jgi:hypothetical protein
MKIDILGYNRDNVGSLYGFNQHYWLVEHGHSVNCFEPITWHTNTDSDILLIWGAEKIDIELFNDLERNKYKHLAYFTITPIYSQFAQPEMKAIHESRIERLKPDILGYMCKEDVILSPFNNKLWFCNNKFANFRPTPWSDKYNGTIYAGKPRQLIKLPNRLMHYPPLSFQMDESLIYYDMFRYTLCPMAGHILHQRVYNAALVKSIPIITVPKECPELDWFPELRHGFNCFIIRDIMDVSELQGATAEIAENMAHVLQIHNFDMSMNELLHRIT